jgi:glucose/mannose-6-phosphate isomerase
MNIIEKLITEFDQQMLKAIQLGESLKISRPAEDIRNVVISGIGGSGIGGSITKSLTVNDLEIPIEVIKSYEIPKYVDKHTLLIASSYSGTTEETLAAVALAGVRGAKIACVTTGGKLYDIATKKGYDIAKIPQEEPCPRAYLGYSLIQQMYLLIHYQLISNNYRNQLKSAYTLISEQKETIKQMAEDIAEQLHNRLPIIYTDNNLNPLAVRFQQQINENAKQFCHVNVFPEMNHNELVGWVHPQHILHNTAVVLVNSTFNNPRVNLRMKICKGIFSKITDRILEIDLEGTSLVEQTFYFIHLTDWVSYYLALKNDVDPYQIKVIDFLKSELAKI